MKKLMRKYGSSGLSAVALMAGLMFGSAASRAQSVGTPSSQDKTFVKDTAQDSNYEIKTGQLALQKSSSADVKQYANTVIRDHTRLKQETVLAEKAAGMDAKPDDGMSLSDDASYAKLKVLSGDSFDKAYIQGLLKGNEDSLKQGRAEAAGTTVPSIKKLAGQRVAFDTKHTEAAEALAQAHGVQAGR